MTLYGVGTHCSLWRMLFWFEPPTSLSWPPTYLKKVVGAGGGWISTPSPHIFSLRPSPTFMCQPPTYNFHVSFSGEKCLHLQNIQTKFGNFSTNKLTKNCALFARIVFLPFLTSNNAEKRHKVNTHLLLKKSQPFTYFSKSHLYFF